jgi:hypothetical protein
MMNLISGILLILIIIVLIVGLSCLGGGRSMNGWDGE